MVPSIAAAFEKVSQNERHRNQWIASDVWATLVNEVLKWPDDLKVTGSQLSLTLVTRKNSKYNAVRNVLELYNSHNDYGLFRYKYNQTVAFYVTEPTSSPRSNDHMPGGNNYQLVRDIALLGASIQTRAQEELNNTTTESTTPSMLPSPPPEEERPPRKKQRRYMEPPTTDQQGRFNDGKFGQWRRALGTGADHSNNGTDKQKSENWNAHHLSKSLNMVLKVKDTGTTTIWSCSSKSALIALMFLTAINMTIVSCLTTHPAMINKDLMVSPPPRCLRTLGEVNPG